MWAKDQKPPLRFVYAYEPHPGGHGVHVHFVTPQLWDTGMIRPKATDLGWGRVNAARPKPVEYAVYIGKYLRKHVWHSKDRGSKWGCVGFRGTKVMSVVAWEKRLTLVADVPRYYPDGVCWTLSTGGMLHYRRSACIRPDVLEERCIVMKDLKSEQQKEILASVLRGDIVIVGEYRSQLVGHFKKKDRDDPSVLVEQVTVKHCVEFAGGLPKVVTEWLPPGTDPAGVKVAAQRGDTVMVSVSSVKWFRGVQEISGSVKPLTQLV